MDAGIGCGFATWMVRWSRLGFNPQTNQFCFAILGEESLVKNVAKKVVSIYLYLLQKDRSLTSLVLLHLIITRAAPRHRLQSPAPPP